MNEISSQTSQLDIHVSVIAMEKENRRKAEEKQKEIDEEKERRDLEMLQRQQQHDEEQLVAADEATSRALIQEVVHEAQSSGTPLSAAVTKLLNHLKCK